jgi:hypothetical protein
MQQLIYLAILFALLICTLTAYSLFQQLGSHLKLSENRYGIMLAVGAQPSAIILAIWRDLGMALFLAGIAVYVIMLWAAPLAFAQLQVNLLNWIAVGTSLVLTIALCLLSSLVPSLRLTQRPVSSMLFAQD